MFTLVTMDQYWVVSAVKDGSQGGGDFVRWNGDERLLVSGYAKLEECDSVLIEEGRICFRVLLEDQGENRAETEGAEKGKVFLFRERGAVDV